MTAWYAQGESEIAYKPSEESTALQARRFQSLVRHAWERVPYYRQWMKDAGARPEDLRSADDLRRMPIVEKAALALEPERFAAQGYGERDGLTLWTSGTSGLRQWFRYDADALFQVLAAGRRQRIALAHLVGKEAGYREAVVKRPGNPGVHLRQFWEERMWIPRGIELDRRNLDAAQKFEDLLAGINEFRPKVVRGIGSHLGAFFRWVGETGRPLIKPRAVAYDADLMPAGDRCFIERELGIPVVSTYEAVEALRIGFQCEVRSGYHISTDQVILRVVDDAGRDVAPGERGSVVLTNLVNRAMAVLNYRLGDMVTLAAGRCACGRTFPLIQDIDGRLEDLIARPAGQSLHSISVLPELQRVAGVRQVQIVQEEIDRFLLRVVWAQGSAPRPAELARRMAEVVGAPVRVTVEAVDRIAQEPSGKVRSMIREVGVA